MLEVKNLGKKFDNKLLFKNVTIKLKESDFLVLTGPSGSGKSTLLNIVGMLDKKYDGDFFLMGLKNPSIKSKLGRNLLRHDIGYMFQNYGLVDNDTVENNLLLAIEYQKIKLFEKQKKIKEVLAKVGIANYEKKKVYKLSGGEQQRVAIAKIILKNVKLILADEPTGSLDEENKKNVLKLLEDLNKKGTTILMVSHDKEIINKYRSINMRSFYENK